MSKFPRGNITHNAEETRLPPYAIEIKPCKHCGCYPDIKVNLGGMAFSVVCSYCSKGSLLRAENHDKSKYNEVFNEIISCWNKEQEA